MLTVHKQFQSTKDTSRPKLLFVPKTSMERFLRIYTTIIRVVQYTEFKISQNWEYLVEFFSPGISVLKYPEEKKEVFL